MSGSWRNTSCCLALTTAMVASPASAQDGQQPPPQVVVLPKALATPTAYPAQATNAATVLLEITVDKRGRASAPTVLDGDEPFMAAALAAVSDWRFLPATQNGVPVAARIRFLVRFESSPVEPAKASANESSTKPDEPKPLTPLAKAANSSRPLEVTVTGKRPEVAVVSMGRAEVEQLPGVFGDPFRAIEVLPGVTPMVSGLPFYFIRGAPPGNQGYFLDGIRVPFLYHMAAGPGVIHPALVDRVDLYSGGYPARHGRFAGAIVAGESSEPLPQYHALGSIRLVDSGAYVTAPLGRGSVALGGRYSYTGAVVSLISPNIKLEYWDYQAKAVQHLTERDTIGIFAFGSLDRVEDKSADSEYRLMGTEFHRVDLRYERQQSSKTRIKSAVTLGLDKTLAGGALTVRDRLAAIRSVMEHRLSGSANLRAGFDAGLDTYDVRIPVPGESNIRLRASLPERTETVVGGWVDLPFEPSRGVTFVPGLRVDYYATGDATALAVEPRASASFAVRRHVRLVHALGLAHQPPSFAIPIPGFQIAGLKDGLQRSLQSSSGVEVELPEDVSASATLFQNAFFNLTDQLSASNRPTGNERVVEPTLRSRGRTFGAELLVRRAFSHRIGWHIAYTLSKSWRELEGIRVPAAFDRRHVIQVALAFDLGKKWRSSIRAVTYSGLPSFSDNGYLDYEGGESAPRTNPQHLPRTPWYWRLDLRVQKRWPVGTHGAYWAVTFEALNATLNREVVSQSCSPYQCIQQKIGPITLPSLGVEAAY